MVVYQVVRLSNDEMDTMNWEEWRWRRSWRYSIITVPS